MRYYVFLMLIGIALVLDMVLLGLHMVPPPRPAASAASSPPRPIPRAVVVRRAASLPTHTPTPTTPPSPTPSPAPTATATFVPTSTPTPEPQLIASNEVTFTPSDPAVRANIRLALRHYSGALARVVVQPGGTFSFNAALGADPDRLPWRNVVTHATAVPPAAPDEPTPAPITTRIFGGGLCDLASRYVMAARPLLPRQAFHFVNHVSSNGVRLHGVPVRDSVAIWAVGGRAGERDLRIQNLTDDWLEFIVEQNQAQITVRAQLWDRLPPL